MPRQQTFVARGFVQALGGRVDFICYSVGQSMSGAQMLLGYTPSFAHYLKGVGKEVHVVLYESFHHTLERTILWTDTFPCVRKFDFQANSLSCSKNESIPFRSDMFCGGLTHLCKASSCMIAFLEMCHAAEYFALLQKTMSLHAIQVVTTSIPPGSQMVKWDGCWLVFFIL